MEIRRSIEASSDGVWVDWRDGARIKLRLSPGIFKELRKKCSEKRVVNGQVKEELNQEKFDEALNDHIIVEWAGITMDGQAFPCTPENKTLLMTQSFGFSSFVNQACLDLETIQENERKNS